MKKTGKRLLAAMLLFCTILIGAAGYEVMAADEAQSTESTSETVNSADDLPEKESVSSLVLQEIFMSVITRAMAPAPWWSVTTKVRMRSRH